MMNKEEPLPAFYLCPMCGNLIEKIHSSGQPLICCGKEMKLLVPASTDGTIEKHVPQYETHDHKVVVHVGSLPHPMTEEHYINWIELVTNKGIQRRKLNPKDEPAVCFPLGKHEEPITVYAYCNIHGLWRK